MQGLFLTAGGGTGCPLSSLVFPKEDSGEISKNSRGESNEITFLKHHKQGPIGSCILRWLRPMPRARLGQTQCQWGLLSAPKCKLLGRGRNSRKRLKCRAKKLLKMQNYRPYFHCNMRAKYYITGTFSSIPQRKEVQRLRNSSASSSPFR